MKFQHSKNGSNIVCEKGTFLQIWSHILMQFFDGSTSQLYVTVSAKTRLVRTLKKNFLFTQQYQQ